MVSDCRVALQLPRKYSSPAATGYVSPQKNSWSKLTWPNMFVACKSFKTSVIYSAISVPFENKVNSKSYQI